MKKNPPPKTTLEDKRGVSSVLRGGRGFWRGGNTCSRFLPWLPLTASLQAAGEIIVNAILIRFLSHL